MWTLRQRQMDIRVVSVHGIALYRLHSFTPSSSQRTCYLPLAHTHSPHSPLVMLNLAILFLATFALADTVLIHPGDDDLCIRADAPREREQLSQWVSYLCQG